MFKFLKSKIIIIYLRVLGLKVDFGAKFSNIPLLDIKGNARDIVIGKVVILGEIDIRNRESGKIIFENGCKIEAGCRFVSARNGTIKIAEGTVITTGAIINGGADVMIGQNCIFGPRVIINANEHVFKKNQLIKDQGFIHKRISVGNDCWFGANVAVNKGVTISSGSVIGAYSLVTKDTEPNSINFGIPTKKIGYRVD